MFSGRSPYLRALISVVLHIFQHYDLQLTDQQRLSAQP